MLMCVFIRSAEPLLLSFESFRRTIPRYPVSLTRARILFNALVFLQPQHEVCFLTLQIRRVAYLYLQHSALQLVPEGDDHL